jgi:hypothetical protein
MSKSLSRGQAPLIEPLESRIAPAALTFINPQEASFIDADGSRAYVTVTAGTLKASNFTLAPAGLGYQLETLDLSKTDFGSMFEGVSVDIFAQKSSIGGDGTVNIGYVNATGINLGDIHVRGDLGQITAGSGSEVALAIHGIDVLSMGELGTTTQAAGGSLTSIITGSVGTWIVKGNLDGALIANFAVSPSFGFFHRVDIGGSVLGGGIDIVGGMRRLTIGGSIVGGSADSTGLIQSSGTIDFLDIGGSLIGGGGEVSGYVSAARIHQTVIGGDITGGAGEDSGTIDVIGNSSDLYGGTITVHGSLIGGEGPESGTINGTNPSRVVIDGSIIGGGGEGSGEVEALRFLYIRIGGSIEGGVGGDSGGIATYSSNGVIHIQRDLIGGNGPDSGFIGSFKHLGAIIISGSIEGGSSIDSGAITVSAGGIASVDVGGSVVGGAGIFSAAIRAEGSIGSVAIHGDLTAGGGMQSASILGAGSIGSIFVGGDVNGDADTGIQVTGAVNGFLGSLTIGIDLQVPLSIDFPVGDMRVEGSIGVGSSATQVALIGTTINKLVVNGDILGTDSNPVDLLLAGPLGLTGLTLGNLKVIGSVTDANILAGYAPDTAGTVLPYEVVDPAARVGTVSTGGDWTASNLVAGVSAGTDGLFGTLDDFTTNMTTTFSEITRIVIHGEAVGSTDSSEHFGFVAQEVAAVSVAGYSYTLTPCPGNDTSVTDPALQVGPTGNFDIHEVATAMVV